MLNDVSNGRRSRRSSIGEGGAVFVCGVEMSNQFLLKVAAFSFLAFVVAEIVGALASNSLSLLGDAAAMSVDVFTYFCNMYSEHVKSKYGEVDITTRMVLEVGIPLFSATALIAVSAWITNDAILIILDPSDSVDVKVVFLFAFAIGNAIIDVICAALFYLRRRDVLKTPLKSVEVQESLLEHQHQKDYETGESTSESKELQPSSSSEAHNTNLNMASALTHVGGDSLRTGAVFVAATVASVTDLNPTLCDAWAAVVVTITILFLVGPLLSEIRKAYSRLSTEKLILAGASTAGESRESTY